MLLLIRDRVLVVAVAVFVVFGWLAVPASAAVRPDLTVAAVAAPASVSVKGILAVSFSVRNGGRAAATGSSVAFFLSGDRRVGRDVQLGAASVLRLGARLSVAGESELALPRSTRVGRFYLVACADRARRVKESNERNNCRVSRQAVRVVRARVELAVSSTGALPAALRADRASSLTVTVRNRGALRSATARVEVLVSRDGRRNAGDVVVGSRPVPRLAGRARSVLAVALVVPFSVRSGSYRVLVCVGRACRVSAPTSVVDAAVDAPPNPIDRPTDFVSSTAFLYTGPNASQHGVAAGAISAERVAVVRGRVVDRAGRPVAGVRVAVLSHPELGFTQTRLDGMFDLAVNGGGPVDVDYRIAGFLPVQRSEDAPWRNYTSVPDVVLTAVDVAVTTITSGGAGWQTHRASAVVDADGTRRATLLFAPGTKASLRMADGALKAAASIRVRATEFTTGGGAGLAAMPGALPPASGYTYAVEYSADEAIAAGAVGVSFDRPVVTYTEDFVGFPVGAVVPAGSYDAGDGRWEAGDNGRVVKVVAVTAGRAALDLTGDGVADAGIADGELDQVGRLYAVGVELMRVEVRHFSASDLNWPYGPPAGASGPNGGPQNDAPGGSCAAGSIIVCESQTLAERIPIAGTGYALVYASDRVAGRVASRSLVIPLRPASLPLVPTAIHVIVQAAGQTISEDFAGSALTTTFTWDGRDGYGRPVLGWVPVVVQVGYEFQGQYYATRADQTKAFGAFSGVTFTQDTPAPGGTRRASGTVNVGMRLPIIIWREWRTTVGSWDLRGIGLGGWTIDPLEVYDRDAGFLLNGDGTAERADRTPYDALTLLAGWNGAGTPGGFAGDGSKAVGARLFSPDGVAVAPDGTVYIADPGNGRVRRVALDGTISSIYGGSSCPTPTCRPVDVAIGNDGSLYIADTARYRVLRLAAATGVETVVAGSGVVGYSGDGGAASAARLTAPTAIAVGPDDAVWIKDTGPLNDARVRRVAPDGTITTEIGGGPAAPGSNPYGDGLPATQIRLGNVGDNGLAVAPDGTVYVVDFLSSSFIRAVGTDGISRRFAGAGPAGPGVGDGGPATDAKLYQAHSLAVGPDGSLYIGESARLRRVAPDGTISTLAGDGVGSGYLGDGGPAAAARVYAVAAIAVAPNGDVVFADRDNHRVRVVRSVLPNVAAGELALAASDGREVYRFDASGRHVETRDGLTGTVTIRLRYDASGRLVTVTDRHGLVTTIEHDATGNPTLIVAPGGQRTVLQTGAGGYLSAIKDPLGEASHFTYAGAGGLLETLTDERANVHSFGYDALGRLVSDHDPAGGTQTLTRTILADGIEVTRTTALGRQTVYRYAAQPDGSIRSRTTMPSGAFTETLERADGTIRIDHDDGRVEDLTTGPDPRFGQRVPIVIGDVVAEPGGPTSTTTATRTATTLPGGGVATLTDAIVRNGAAWTLTYSSATRTIATTSPAGRTTSTTLTTTDDIGSQQQGTLAASTFTYDARGRMTRAEQGPLHYDLGYDNADRLTTVTDALGDTESYGYDAADRLATLTLPSGRRYAIARDAAGNANAIDTPGPATSHHTLSSDPLNRLASYTAPGRGTLAITYTADRDPATTTQPDATTITRSYDAAGRSTTETFAGASATLTYSDSTDRVATASRGAQSTTFEYHGNLATRANQTGATSGDFTYTYGADLDLTAWSLDGAASTVTHDADRLLNGDGPWTRTINGNGLVTAITSAADVTDHITLSYDALGRVTSRTVTVNNTPVHALTLTYDAAGRIATRTDTGSGTRTYSYDSDSRLTTVSGAETSAYTYDTRDNLTSSPAGTTTYTADDRVASSTYDPNGRLAGRGPDSFTYSPRGELLSATVGGVTATYTYDSAARRVTRTAAGVTTQYLYGSLDDPTQLTASRTAATGLSIYRYDAAGMLIAIERGTNRYLVATDPVGSPIAAYDTVTTAIVLQRSYDAYGRLTTTSGTLDLPIGYAGGLTDPTTGLTRFGQRDYDPDTGRFTAPDPILYGGGQLNLYTYVNANPISHTDPLGLADGGQSRQPAPKVCRNDETSIRRELNEWDRLLQANGRTGKTDDATVKRGHDIESTMHRLTDHVPLLGDGKPISSHALASSGAATRS